MRKGEQMDPEFYEAMVRRTRTPEARLRAANSLRARKCEKSPIFTDDEVLKIREMISYGCTNREIADEFKCFPAIIWFIRIGQTYKHVQPS
jgi:hypothetical protein